MLDIIAPEVDETASRYNTRKYRQSFEEKILIHVIATIELAPGTREKFLAEFRKLVPEVKAEVGCIAYGPAIDAQTDIVAQARIGADKVVIVEQWESIAALKAHAVAPHMQAYRGRVKEFVKGMELRVLQPT